jgi:hypothetical protein
MAKIGDRLRGRHRSDDEPREIVDGDTYTIDDLEAGRVVLMEDEPDPNPPDEAVRGEPWGWTKGPPYPRGYREDGRYDQS